MLASNVVLLISFLLACSEGILAYKKVVQKSNESNIFSTEECSRPVDCGEILLQGRSKSGVYTVYPRSRILSSDSIQVYCDMSTDGGGWTLLQRRGQFGSPNNYFQKSWDSYKKGFGHLEKEFWIGNDKLFALTNQGQYTVRFDLRLLNGTAAYAAYGQFYIDDESQKYTLHISDYSDGKAGDGLKFHDRQQFSVTSGTSGWGGWWDYMNGDYSNLNGLKPNRDMQIYGSMNWYTLGGESFSVETSEIKIRRRCPKELSSRKQELLH